MDPQHPRKVAGLNFAAHRAVNHVVLRGHSRQDRGDETRVSLVGDGGGFAKFFAGQSTDSRLRQQLKLEPLRAEPRNLIESAPRMTRNRDQRHVTTFILPRGDLPGM